MRCNKQFFNTHRRNTSKWICDRFKNLCMESSKNIARARFLCTSTYDVNLPSFTFYHERKQTTSNFSFTFWTIWWRSHWVSFGHVGNEKKRKEKKTKKVEKSVEILGLSYFPVFFFLPLLLLKRNFVFVKPVFTNSNNYFRQIPPKKSSKIKCGMCGFFSMWRQFLTRCQRCACSPAFNFIF